MPWSYAATSPRVTRHQGPESMHRFVEVRCWFVTGGENYERCQ